MVMPVWRPSPNNTGVSIGDPPPIVFTSGPNGAYVTGPLTIQGTTVLYFGDATHYIFWTGSVYNFANGGITFAPDNSYDIGASGANRPRNIYAAGDINGGNNLNVPGTASAGGFNGAYLQFAGATVALRGGTGAPAAGLGANGDYYFRQDTPGTANQRIYVKSAGAWVGIV